jgi:hypothetical protein
MPHKYNADRRHHIARPKRRVTNWSKYNEALRQRGSLIVWFTDDAIAAESTRNRGASASLGWMARFIICSLPYIGLCPPTMPSAPRSLTQPKLPHGFCCSPSKRLSLLDPQSRGSPPGRRLRGSVEGTLRNLELIRIETSSSMSIPGEELHKASHQT